MPVGTCVCAFLGGEVCTRNRSGAVGRLRIQGWFLDRLSVWGQLLDGSTLSVFPTNGVLSWSSRERSSIRPDCICVCMNTVFSCVDLCGQPCVYACLRVQLWEYVLSLVTGWTWGCGVAAALSPLGCGVQQPLTQENYFSCRVWRCRNHWL